MIQLRIFREHYVILACIIAGFFLIGTLMSRLLLQFSERQAHRPAPPGDFFLLFSLLTAVSILLGVGVALYFLYRSLSRKVELADQVISELQRGNLKARFPIQRRDEVGAAMLRFNRMADEIEHLVERIRRTERARMTLLQDLAHDLRTPIASLKNLLETLQHKRAVLPPERQQELLDLSVREAEYFEALVEDLLVLAQVSEPRYQRASAAVDLIDLLEQEITAMGVRHASRHRPVEIRAVLPEGPLRVPGDSVLLHRLFKNALENGYSFARKRLEIELAREEKYVTVLIRDDGPGFTAEALAAFGVRRLSRTLGTQESDNARLSVGLGSVIMKAVADAHRGSLKAENRVGSNGRIQGATVAIRLPA